ncbi:MAG: hypothetical protein KGY78_12060 [Anaerolineae bacterium]|nr:hypothetical protein [Anaerolineae bacterium]
MSDNQVIPFDQLKGKIPAAVRALQGQVDEDWASGQSAGFPVMSIKGKVFRIKRGDDYELVTRPDDPDEAASTLQITVIRAGKGVARTYYATSYDEDSHEAPDCYSNDGVAPAADAENKQAKKCATCPHAQWGSRISESGKKGKACSEVKRLAVAAPGAENDPMLLRIPPTSLRYWDQYVAKLNKKGLNPSMVVTKIGFDPEVAHQQLTFKPVGLINDTMAQTIAEMREEAIVKDIIGVGPNSGAPVDTTNDPDENEDAPLEKVPESEPDTEKPTKAAQPADDDLDLDLGLDTEEAKKEAEPKKAEVKSAAASEPTKESAKESTGDAISDELDDMLSDLNFDD